MEPRPNREEVEQRVARFDQVQPMSISKHLADIPHEAKDIIFAGTLIPGILEKTKTLFCDTAAIYRAAGTTMNVSVCPPGQGPCFRSHDHTYETFMVFDGAFEFSVGDKGQETLALNKWDVFWYPPSMYRGFRNVADTHSVLLTVITGAVHERHDGSVSPKVTQQVRDGFGEEVLRAFKKIANFHERNEREQT